MKRSLSLILALLMAMSLCAGVLAEGEPTYPLSSYSEFATPHEATILCFEMGWTGPESDLDIITPEIARRTNFTMKYEPQTVTSGDDLNSKLNLMVASNSVPDIYFGPADSYSRAIYDKLCDAGTIWNFAPYIEDYPNIFNLIKPEFLQYYNREKKTMPFIPTQNGRGFDATHSANGDGLFLRDDLLKKLGMEYPDTPEALYEFLKRCKEEIRESGGMPIIPLTMDEGSILDGIAWFFFPYGPQSPGGGGLPFDYHDNNKVLNYMYTNSPELTRAMKYANKLYQEGLMDREVITHKRAQYMEKVSSGRVGAMWSAWWDMNTFSDQAKEIEPNLMYCIPPDIADRANGMPWNQEDKWTNWVGYWSSLVVSTKLDEATMRHYLATLDYLASRDGQILVQLGLEGDTFEYNKDGKAFFTDSFKERTGNLDWNRCSAYGVSYWQQVVNNFPAYEDLLSEYPEIVRADNYKGWQNKKQRWDRYDPDMMPLKYQYFVEGEQEIRLMPAINEARREMYTKVLVAKSEEEIDQVLVDWDKTCKDLGIDEVIAERQAFIDNLEIMTDLPK